MRVHRRSLFPWSFPKKQHFGSHGTCLKILKTYLIFFSNKMLVIRAGTKKNIGQKSKQGRPRSDCLFRSSLFWVCPVYLAYFGRQLLIKILGHLLYIWGLILIGKRICWSGPDWSCGPDQIGLVLRNGLATGNHVIQYHM